MWVLCGFNLEGIKANWTGSRIFKFPGSMFRNMEWCLQKNIKMNTRNTNPKFEIEHGPILTVLITVHHQKYGLFYFFWLASASVIGINPSNMAIESVCKQWVSPWSTMHYEYPGIWTGILRIGPNVNMIQGFFYGWIQQKSMVLS